MKNHPVYSYTTMPKYIQYVLLDCYPLHPPPFCLIARLRLLCVAALSGPAILHVHSMIR